MRGKSKKIITRKKNSEDRIGQKTAAQADKH
jgi:hypothetical protein